MLPAPGSSQAGPLLCPTVAVLQHEGAFPVMANTAPVLVGSHYRVGYLARPDQAGQFPTVVLVPDLGVLGSQEKSLARRLARHGLAVIACNLTEGADAEAEHAALADEEARRVLDEVRGWAASDDNPWAIGERLGVLGVESGGRFALIQGAHRNWVGAVACVAGALTGDEDRRYPVIDMLAHLPVPVLGLYGADDAVTPATAVDDAQQRNASGTWLLYAGAGHGFYDEASPQYSQDAAEDAIARLAAFFLAKLPRSEASISG